MYKFFFAATKPRAKRNKTGFISYSPEYPPLNSRVKDKTSFEFLFCYRFDTANLKH